MNACSSEIPHNTYPVQIAAYDGLLDILDTLVNHGADITVETENGCTLIHLAVFNDALAIMRYLLEREADIEIPAKSGVTPLCSATMHSLEKGAAELLLRAGANPNAEYAGGMTPLAENHDPAIAKLLWLDRLPATEMGAISGLSRRPRCKFCLLPALPASPKVW